MKRDVFISYSRMNYDAVMEIKRQIDTATGADCWKEIEDRIARLDKEVGWLRTFEDSNGKWGFTGKRGKVVIPCQWDIACDFRKGFARVEDSNGNWWKIDKTGKVVGKTW